MAQKTTRREHWRQIIFEAETPAGRRFDLVVLGVILFSILAVMLESVAEISACVGPVLYAAEWGFTVVFMIEYGLRLWTSHDPARYARSFFGMVDLLSILPSFIGLLLPGGQALMVVRVLRLLRVFRVLKMARHIRGAVLLLRSLQASRAKITVFFSALATIALIAGSLMYLVEGEAGGFDNIPIGVYWAVVTITTLGFGDITPTTPVGQLLTTVLALTGYAIIAVPTGIVTAEISRREGTEHTRACPACGVQGHLPDARYCRRCGAKMD